jgi:hypothetical protein
LPSLRLWEWVIVALFVVCGECKGETTRSLATPAQGTQLTTAIGCVVTILATLLTPNTGDGITKIPVIQMAKLRAKVQIQCGMQRMLNQTIEV